MILISGPLLFYKASAFKQAADKMNIVYKHAALYDLRLKISQHGKISISLNISTQWKKKTTGVPEKSNSTM